MCRLFAQISARSIGAEDFLVDGKRSLLVQSDFRKTSLQKDGWGFGYFKNSIPKTIKSSGAAFLEKARFKEASSGIRSRVVFGHLRHASNPLGLPRARLIGPGNAQPFCDDRFLFVHNGALEIPNEVRSFLGPYRERVRGDNDSEVYFWQLRKQIDLYGDVPRALEACLDELAGLWELCRSRHRDKRRPHSGLNTIISDGRSLHAMCLFPESKGKSLFNPKKRWGTMSVGRRGDRVIVASEDLDTGPWIHLRPGEIVSVTPSGSGRFSIRRRLLRLVPPIY